MKKEFGTVFNIQKYSLHDGSGIRTNIFFKGCPLKCLWCSNPESQQYYKELVVNENECMGCSECVKRCPNNAITLSTWDREKCDECNRCQDICPTGAREFLGKEMTVEEIEKEVMKDWQFYNRSGGGVTFSGGEALSQADFVATLAESLKKKYVHTAIETCGCVPWEQAYKVLRYVDEILYDIKHMDSRIHKNLTGLGNELVLENANNAAMLGKHMVIRVPVIGGVNDNQDNISRTAMFANEIHVNDIHLLPYHRYGENKYKKLNREYSCEAYTPSDEQMKELQEIVVKHGVICKIGG